MSLRTLEAEILKELRVVAKNSKIRQKDIMEWSTGEIKPHEGETLFFLPVLKVWCAVKIEQPIKKAQAEKTVQEPDFCLQGQPPERRD